MELNAQIVQEAAIYVRKYLSVNLEKKFTFHNWNHTMNVVEAAEEISSAINLDKHDHRIVSTAALFHDLGYTCQIENHEIAGARIAEKFLQDKQVDNADIAMVKDCILATHYPQNPRSTIEKILCDADMFHLAEKKYLEKIEPLRKEWELTKNKKFTDEEWYRINIEFLNNHKFHTAYCRENFDKQKTKNQRILAEKEATIKLQTGREIQKATRPSKERKLERGVETLFRTTSRNHMELSRMADSKAHILLSICSIIISIIISILLKKLEQSHYLILPTLILLVVCLTTIVFAVLTTKPKVPNGKFTKEELANKKTNLMFFGNFHNMDIDTYCYGVKEMMYDTDYLYGSMTKDIYYMGKILAVKYRYLNVGYKVFMYGMIASVLAFTICFYLFNQVQTNF